jgi:DNA polymerase III epsilon subunit-like protein
MHGKKRKEQSVEYKWAIRAQHDRSSTRGSNPTHCVLIYGRTWRVCLSFFNVEITPLSIPDTAAIEQIKMGSTSRSDERSEIVFFDVETTVPTRTGQGFGLLEFGAILVCPRKLVELESYSTLVQPTDLSLISSLSVRCNGITRDAVVSAPTFSEIADRVYDILQGRSLS